MASVGSNYFRKRVAELEKACDIKDDYIQFLRKLLTELYGADWHGISEKRAEQIGAARRRYRQCRGLS